MKVVVQRAGTSSVMVNEKCVGKIDSGLVLLVAFKETDTIDTINYMVKNYAYNKNHINDKSNKFIKGPVNYLNKETKITPADRKNFLGLVGALSDNEIKKLLYEVLTPIGYNLMVTPKEVDFILSKLSDVISYGINHSIHNI